MTVKTYDQLIASFPNNTTGLVKPINIRDFVDSVELKYDNYTVVKSGQPTGNRFPAPSGGFITLPDDTVWIINGIVTLTTPLRLGNNVTIAGISGSYFTDQISLDPTAGAVALINQTATGSSATFANIGLLSTGGTGTLLNLTEPTIATFSQVAFVYDDGGSIDFAGGDCYFVDQCINLLTDQPIQFTGTGGNIIFDGIRSGISNSAIQYDLQGTFDAVFVRNCYNEAGFAMLQIDEATTSVGVISNNAAGGGADLVTGVDASSVNWTFSGNSGIANTVIGGSLNMSLNADVTTNGGQGVFVPIIGNSNDTLSPDPCRISRSGDLEITYDGNETIVALITISASIKRSAGSGSTRVSIGLEKNGTLLSTPKTVSISGITHVTTTATATLAAAFPLTNGMSVTISGADQAPYNGTFVISGVAGNDFDYTMLSDPAASATGTISAIVPIESVIGIGVKGEELPFTLHVQTTLSTGDAIVPVLRPDASGVIDFVVEDLFLVISS